MNQSTTTNAPTSRPPSPGAAEDLAAIRAQLDDLSASIGQMTARQDMLAELFVDALPILKGMSAQAAAMMSKGQDKGYFAFAAASAGVLERVVTGFSAQDVDALGDNIVRILQLVRQATQPEMLSAVGEVAEAIDDPQADKPLGVFGALKATRDDDVQRGIALAVSVLRHVGRASLAAESPQERPKTSGAQNEDAAQRLAKMLAPKGDAAAVRKTPRPSTSNGRVTPAGAPPSGTATISFGGAEWSADGFLLRPDDWTPALANAVAASQGIATLSDAHWTVINYARERFLETGVSCNVRALTIGSGINTRDLYKLFPLAPGITAARVAGVPKPKGCI